MAPSSEPAAGRDSPCPSQFLTLFSGAHPIRPGPPRAPCLSESSQGLRESELPPLLPCPASQAHEALSSLLPTPRVHLCLGSVGPGPHMAVPVLARLSAGKQRVVCLCPLPGPGQLAHAHSSGRGPGPWCWPRVGAPPLWPLLGS